MTNFTIVMKYRQKRVTVKRVLSLVLKILVILEKAFSLFKNFPFLRCYLDHHAYIEITQRKFQNKSGWRKRLYSVEDRFYLKAR